MRGGKKGQRESSSQTTVCWERFWFFVGFGFRFKFEGGFWISMVLGFGKELGIFKCVERRGFIIKISNLFFILRWFSFYGRRSGTVFELKWANLLVIIFLKEILGRFNFNLQ
jgi:hypothetical protein